MHPLKDNVIWQVLRQALTTPGVALLAHKYTVGGVGQLCELSTAAPWPALSNEITSPYI